VKVFTVSPYGAGIQPTARKFVKHDSECCECDESLVGQDRCPMIRRTASTRSEARPRSTGRESWSHDEHGLFVTCARRVALPSAIGTAELVSIRTIPPRTPGRHFFHEVG